jgi:multidrug efflux pump subunit AcrB
MGLIKASLKNPFMVAALVSVMIILGSVAVYFIPVDILPVFKAPAVQVLTYYQGMPPGSVEKTITNRIERWVNQATGCAKVESKSVQGVSVVKCYFRDDIDPNGALTQVNSLALGTLPTLPPNTLPPVVLPFDPTGTIPLGILTVKNPDMNEAEVKDLARINVRNMLGGVKGCVAPVVVGGKDRTVLVYIEPDQLQARHLSLLDAVEALRRGNLMATPGIAYVGKNQYMLDSNAMVEKVQELNDLPVSFDPKRQIFLRDIGHAEDAYAIQTSRVRIDGRQQVYVPVYKQGGASSLAVAQGVQNAIPEMESRLPHGSKLEYVMDQTVYVKEAIESLVHEGIIGAVLVSVMILVFLGNWRMTLIASTSIPLAILGSLIGLYVTGNTVNAMTLGGLALAIGPLVDDAIVSLENIHRHQHALGKSRLKAALDGCVEVMVPVLVATCTTMIVLAPIALMPGMGGFLFKPLALAVAFAMISSFFLSRTYVPMLCSRILPETHGAHRHAGAPMHLDATNPGLEVPEEPPVGADGQPVVHARPAPGFFARLYGHFDRALTYANGRYLVALSVALRHRFLVLGGVLALFLAALSLLPFIGREFFPQVDAGQITMYLRAPSSDRLDETERRVAEVEEFVKTQVPAEERKMIVSEIGLDPDWSAAYSSNSGQQDAVIRVQMTEDRKLTSQEYAAKLRKAFREEPRFADLKVSFDTGGMVSAALNYGVSSPIDVQVECGGNPEALPTAQRLALEIRDKVVKVPGAADVRIMQRLDAPYKVITVDRKEAARVGLPIRDVISQVTAALNSSVSLDRNFWIDAKTGNQYFVAVQFPEDPDRKLEDILNVVATGTNQAKPVKLSSLVELTPPKGATPVEINHVDLARTVNILVNTEGRDTAGVAGDIEEALKSVTVPTGMKVSLKGEYARMNESFRSLGAGLALAALLVYLLLMGLFRSVVGPFIIMFTVPLGLIGVLATLYLTGTTLNVQSEMGVIFLVGIAVNNGVLLVEFANQQRRAGRGVREAILTSASLRFRPILMTFLATFLDLIPMAIGFGKGSEANVPLARAVVGGLLTSTALTFFVVPILYTLLIKDRPVVDMDSLVETEAAYDLPPADVSAAPAAAH